MKIINLSTGSREYTSNVYYITGDWNRLGDVNTLVDVGRDKSAIKKIMDNTTTGLGKKKVGQVLITHSHYDHTGILSEIDEIFNPTIYASSQNLENVDVILKDGDLIKAGDSIFKAIHTPGHSLDSFCFYCEEEGILFSGDTPLVIHTSGGSYESSFVESLEKLSTLKIDLIFPGHGIPVTKNCNDKILHTLHIVKSTMDI